MSRIFPLLAVASVVVVVQGACASDPGRLEPDAPVPTAACAGPIPACVSACGGEPTRAATCMDGRWGCPSGVSPLGCPEFRGTCGAGDSCGYGYRCVESRGHPVPSDEGLCQFGLPPVSVDVPECGGERPRTAAELLDAAASLAGSVVTVAGTLEVSTHCEAGVCPAESPCCRRCVGDLDLRVSDPGGTALTIRPHTGLLACSGTNCELNCAPLTPGDSTVVWGVLQECRGLDRCRVHVIGTCPL